MSGGILSSLGVGLTSKAILDPLPVRVDCGAARIHFLKTRILGIQLVVLESWISSARSLDRPLVLSHSLALKNHDSSTTILESQNDNKKVDSRG
ncbi:hypothetical protein [Helicobacter zhangjianzhongii]|uniref:Uncharacterized protein n=1 Tax=Helicobacter zhangjianzhongii TaxID=2974574 RepID=A0ACC6FUP1_9HELI|nr:MULTISPECIES: hypothetical protein [unclassified Helicobacter]MDL0080524.1 hypothetical protein [Helicobacter sp. CPD2-1]MDL0082835.1 hypothetical protein [Helicobacter sp. XJK30-2]